MNVFALEIPKLNGASRIFRTLENYEVGEVINIPANTITYVVNSRANNGVSNSYTITPLSANFDLPSYPRKRSASEWLEMPR